MIRYIITFLLIVFFSDFTKAEDNIINFTPVYVSSIIYNNNYLWAGTNKGLIQYNKYTDEYSTYNVNNMNIYPITASETGDIWVGIERSEALLRLQKDLVAIFAEAGWSAENREFSGHLTLCRIKKPRFGRRIAELSKDYSELDFGSLAVDSIRVYQSHLTSSGPVYTVVNENMLS